MGYERLFDQEPTRVASIICSTDAVDSCRKGCRWAPASRRSRRSSPAQVLLAGMDAAEVVAVLVTDTTMTETFSLTDPDGGEDDPPLSLFPGSVVARPWVISIRCLLNTQITSGTGTLSLVSLVHGDEVMTTAIVRLPNAIWEVRDSLSIVGANFGYERESPESFCSYTKLPSRVRTS